ncbi:MAG: hypothetical protein IIT32_12005, partial [Bacteroidales bacterium]|nr:hypothetical protein [Bacteroidales bacterium]
IQIRGRFVAVSPPRIQLLRSLHTVEDTSIKTSLESGRLFAAVSVGKVRKDFFESKHFWRFFQKMFCQVPVHTEI